ncbi:cleft lip and palate associated transmembrane protein [Hyaloraphidium curvatum]|nr:cleft lip and palate associated transmembrane protein [Hyaloraphidium curvatum]
MAEQAPPEARPEDREGGIWNFISYLPRYLMLWWAVSSVVGMVTRQLNPDSASGVSSGTSNASERGPTHALAPLWPLGIKTNLLVVLSEQERLRFWEPTEPPPGRVMDARSIQYGNWSEHRKAETTVRLSDAVRNNGTLFAHAFFYRAGVSPNPRHPLYDRDSVVHVTKLLTVFGPKKKAPKLKKLLGGKRKDNEEPAADDGTPEIVSSWSPNVTFAFVPENVALAPSALPPVIQRHIRPSSDHLHYQPIFFDHTFWTLSDHYVEINRTTEELPLRIELYPMVFWKFNLYQQMDANFKVQEELIGQPRKDTEEFKRMLVDTNPVLLAVTFAVSLLHSIFDILAFKNDVQFWRQKRSMEGLSVRTIVTNVVFQAIVLLYLFDNETSWIVLLSSSVGLIIEAWKVTKALDISITWGLPPSISIKSRQTSNRVKRTLKYDQIAFRYLSYAIAPLLIGYTIYSVVYNEHKSLYSFVISTLVGFVYAFGFISMVPQLYINYRLKSVAHMPMRTLTYKALNTFVDDLFAFVIKMPTLHRLACFRDDIVFFIYIYQWWIYPVDHRRRNEFGQIGVEGADDSEEEDEIDGKLLEEKEAAEKDTPAAGILAGEKDKVAAGASDARSEGASANGVRKRTGKR